MTNSHSKPASNPASNPSATNPKPSGTGTAASKPQPSGKVTASSPTNPKYSNPPSSSISSSIKHLERDIFASLEGTPDKSASFLQEPLPNQLEKLIKEVLQGTDSTCHLYIVNYLTTLRAIAAFGDRPIEDILADFPLKTINQRAFTDFMVQIRTLTLHLKSIAQEEQLKATSLQTPVKDNYLEYLPNNADETNQFCSAFDPDAIKRSGRVGLRGWTTEFDKQVDKIKANNEPHTDPLLGKTIATPVSGGGITHLKSL